MLARHREENERNEKIQAKKKQNSKTKEKNTRVLITLKTAGTKKSCRFGEFLWLSFARPV